MGIIMKDGHQYGAGGIVEQAEDISYDNTSSGLSATNVQGALDEVKSGLIDITNYTDITGTTDTTGNFTVDTIDIEKAIKAIPIRYESQYYTGFYFAMLGGNTNASTLLIHCADANGTPVANKNVKIRVFHIV